MFSKGVLDVLTLINGKGAKRLPAGVSRSGSETMNILIATERKKYEQNNVTSMFM